MWDYDLHLGRESYEKGPIYLSQDRLGVESLHLLWSQNVGDHLISPCQLFVRKNAVRMT